MKRFMLNAKNGAVRDLGATDLPVLAVTSAVEISTIVNAYISGDLTGEQALEQLGRSGTSTLAASYGAAVGTVLMPGIGTVVGSMVSYMASSAMYGSCIQAIHSADMAWEEYLRARELCEASRTAMVQQRMEFERQAGQFLSHRQVTIDRSLQAIMDEIESPDTDRYTEALRALAAEFGRELPFRTDEEFDTFMSDDPAALIF